AQPNLNPSDVQRLYGVMNYYATQWQNSGADRSVWGSVQGLSLQDFPSTSTDNPPDLIRRANAGNLTPQEFAAVRQLLAIPHDAEKYNFDGAGSAAPLRPEEIGLLGQVLKGANGHTFAGMTIVSGDDEKEYFAPRNDAARAFQSELNAARGGLNVEPPEGGWVAGDKIVVNGGTPIDASSAGAPGRAVSLAPEQFDTSANNTVRIVRAGADLKTIEHTVKVDAAALQKAFANANKTFAPFDNDHPERLSASTLLARAYAGELNPAELASLRTWMKKEAQDQGMTCNGALDCLKAGAMRFFRNIARDPVHFFGRNGAFLAASYLYRRFILKNLVEKRLTAMCGGDVANPGQAYRNYEKFVQDQMKSGGFLKSLPRRLLGNPYLGLAVFNLAIAPAKDTGNLAVDIVTDMPLVPLFFSAFETYDAFKSPMLQKFVDANPGLCKSSEAPAPVTVPAPEAVTDGETASARFNAADLKDFTESDFLTYLQPFENFDAAITFSKPVPEALQFLFVGSEGRTGNWWGEAYEKMDALAAPDKLADVVASVYGTDAASQARIKQDMNDLLTAFPTDDQRMRVESFRWAMGQYIRGLETGRPVSGSYLADLTHAGANYSEEGGLARVYFQIKLSQSKQHIPFELAQRQFYGEDISSIVEMMAVRPNTLPSGFSFVENDFDLAGGKANWEDHLAIKRVLPNAGELLVASYAADDPELAARIRSDMKTFGEMYALYGTDAQPITAASTNAYKWALKNYVDALGEGRLIDLSTLRGTFASPGSPMQLNFAMKEKFAVHQEHQDLVTRLSSDPQFRLEYEIGAQRLYWENEKLDPAFKYRHILYGGTEVMPMIEGVPALPSLSMKMPMRMPVRIPLRFSFAL
ncbi:MAG TPA: hypothetical protein VFX30_14775, partial [bacterium]|nr:hypothetical protein [bacterium]